MNLVALVLAQALSLPAVVPVDEDEGVDVLLLAVYHFDNPGLDEMNTEVDDYFLPRRQAELKEVVERLVEFEPSKVFVEARPEEQSILDERFDKYRDGSLELKSLRRGRNEIYQLGFRLARELDLDGLIAVDAPGLWLGQDVNRVAEERDIVPYREGMQRAREAFEAFDEGIKERSVLDNLIRFNRWPSIMGNHSYYVELAPLVVDESQEASSPTKTLNVEGKETWATTLDRRHLGAELVGEWYRRNIKIYANMLHAIEASDERVLLIIGQGHVRILWHLFEDHPRFRVVSANEYLEE